MSSPYQHKVSKAPYQAIQWTADTDSKSLVTCFVREHQPKAELFWQDRKSAKLKDVRGTHGFRLGDWITWAEAEESMNICHCDKFNEAFGPREPEQPEQPKEPKAVRAPKPAPRPKQAKLAEPED